MIVIDFVIAILEKSFNFEKLARLRELDSRFFVYENYINPG